LHRSAILNAAYVRGVRWYVTRKAKDPVKFRDFRFRIHPTDVSVSPGIISGSYERFELDLVSAILRKGDTFIDVGANVGVYSVVGQTAVGPTGRVYAFEPDPENIELLRANLDLNDCQGVSVNAVAVAESDSGAVLQRAHLSSGTHKLIGGVDRLEILDSTDQSPNTIEVNTVHLASWCSEKGVAQPRLLKVDIEGFEPLALDSACLESLRPQAIMVEFVSEHLLSAGFSPKDFFDLLNESRYRCYLISERDKTLVDVTSLTDIKSEKATNLLLLDELFVFDDLPVRQ
jgi:FkbM family methyltransferase